MKIKDIKKYVIGFILGLSLVGGLVFAADTGSIGELFERLTPTGPWRLKQEAIRDGSIEGVKLKDNTLSGSKIIDGSITNDKIQGGISEDKLASGVQSKLNSSIDGKDVNVNNLTVSGSTIINGTLDASVIKSNGIELTKKIKVIDNTWYTLSNLPAFVGKNNVSSSIIDIPDGKYIANIKLTGTGSGFGGACLIFVPNKIAIGISNLSLYINSLKISSNIYDNFFYETYNHPSTPCTNNNNSYINLCFDTSYVSNYIYNGNWAWRLYPNYDHDYNYNLSYDGAMIFYINATTDLISFGGNVYNLGKTDTLQGLNNYYLNNNGIEYLISSDKIYLKRIVTSGMDGGNTSVSCKVEVQYGELVY